MFLGGAPKWYGTFAFHKSLLFERTTKLFTDTKLPKWIPDERKNLASQEKGLKKETYVPIGKYRTICRICLSNDSENHSFLAPCRCCGSTKFVHEKCLSSWMKTSLTDHCEICKAEYKVKFEAKPIKDWKLDGLEKNQKHTFWIVVMITIIFISSFIFGLYVLGYFYLGGNTAKAKDLAETAEMLYVLDAMILVPYGLLCVVVYGELKEQNKRLVAKTKENFALNV